MKKINDISEEKKADLLKLFYFENVQLKELSALFNYSCYQVSKLISNDILKRQSKPDDECK